MFHDETVFLKCCNASKGHWSHMYCPAFAVITIIIWMSECEIQRNGTLSKTTIQSWKRFSCITYNRTLIRRQSYYSYIFYWVAVTHVSAAFNPRCRNGSRWLFNFRRPSICQSSASPRVKIVVFTLPFRSRSCFGFHSAWSNHLCIDFFFATPPPTCKVNLQVYECTIYCV